MTSRSKVLANQLNQTAVYWGNPQSDGFGGRTFDDPVEISVRWSDRQEMFVDMQAQEQVSRAIVHTGTDLVVGGYLYLKGTQITSLPDNLSVGGAIDLSRTQIKMCDTPKHLQNKCFF